MSIEKLTNGTNKTTANLALLALGIGAAWAIKSLLTQTRRIELKEKVVLITGGGRGLGLGLARKFAGEGAKIALCSRQIEELTAAENELREKGTEVFTTVCDVTDEGQVGEMVEAVKKHFGQIDVLVNNAGVIQVMPVENSAKEDFEEAFNTHFWGVYHTTNAVLPEMKKRRAGRIVNISSIGGKVAVPHLLPYCSSKFALTGYSEGLRSELLKDGIYVTTVCPGLMRTGSPRQAVIKGNHELEYAGFKLSDSLPFVTVSAESAAQQIVEACKNGDAEIIISLPAKIAAAVHGLFPNLVTDSFGLFNMLMPKAVPEGNQRKKGKDTETSLSTNFLTGLTETAATQNNEMIS